MSSTRKATGNGPLRQERYASSPEFERGLVANLVAKRCTVLERPEDRDLIWFLQLLSHQPGGLQALAAELQQHFPERLATSSMQRLGTKAGQKYNATQVLQVRGEIPGGNSDYPLRGELDDMELINCPGEPLDIVQLVSSDWKQQRADFMAELRTKAARQPASYQAGTFVTRCRDAAAEHLERHLGELCLDPAMPVTDGPWYFPTLIPTLREYQADWVAKRRAKVVVTELGQTVYDALDYATETRRMVLIDGIARTGKTFAVKAWCEQNPGRARYVQVPSTNDELGFFRAIAGALGMSCGQSWKAVQLRTRIEEVLQTGQLMIVFDEAHYAFPNSGCRTTVPGRINWIMTALINYGVPVALVTTPQFIRTQKAIEQRTGWSSEQLIGRTGRYFPLPDTLSDADLTAVAKSLLPSGNADCIKALVLYAKSSAKYLAGIDTAVACARYFAKKAQREQVTFADVKRTIQETIPSDSALAKALAPSERGRRTRSARPLQTEFTRPAEREEDPHRGVTPVAESNRLETVPG